MDSEQTAGMDRLKALVDRIKAYSKGDEQSPHKYILLLTVAAVVDRNTDHLNRFTFEELEPVFAAQFETHLPHWPTTRRQLEYPFYHLQNDGCWHLQVRDGQEAAYRQYQETRLTRKRLVETIAYAHLDSEILDSLRGRDGRRLVEEKLMALAGRAPADTQANAQLHDVRIDYGMDSPRTSLFEHEERYLRIIGAGLSGIGRLLSNVEIHDSQSNRYYECDVILAARSGLYVVELKHWSGQIHIAANNWLIDGFRYRPDPHRANGFKCKLLKGLYEHRFPTYPNLWVESVVVLTNPDAIVENADSPASAASGSRGNPTFAAVDDFLSYLRKRDSRPAGRVLSDTQVASVVAFLQDQARPPQRDVYTVRGYETVEYLSQRPDRIELVARPLDGRSRGLTRFRIFRLPEAGPSDERARAKRKALNTLDAMSRIGEHPNIHRVWTLRNDEGDIVEGSDWSEAGTLRDLIADKSRSPSIEEALQICRGIALALAAAHDAGIIHRAVKPEHVLIMNGIPKLTDFDLSFSLERKAGDITVLPDPSKLKDDGYTAPELLAGQDIDEGTDVFALGVIAYELLSGAQPFASVRELATLGGRLGDEPARGLAAKGVPARVLAAIRDSTTADRALRLKDARQMAAAFAPTDAPDAAVPSTPNARLKAGDCYDVYEILGPLGEGAEAQTYRAKTIRGEQVALKLFNREVPRERIFHEAELYSAVASPHVVRCDGRMGHWNGERYFLVLEYVEGQTLRERIALGDKPDPESLRKVALGLLDALQAFHGHLDENGQPEPLVHGDIKPDNILLTREGEPKLTDLSVSGLERIDEFAGTVGYVPPDRILGAEMQFARDGDMFALGVTLWEWLFGHKPYQDPAVGDSAVAPAQPNPGWPQAELRWLEKAVATTAQRRFASAEEMRDGLLAADAEMEKRVAPQPELAPMDVVVMPTADVLRPAVATQPHAVGVFMEHPNPFVAYLNTLSSASAGNENATAEAQSSNREQFERVYVPNPLAGFVLGELANKHNVILTGNAGDGKTTIAAEVHRALTGQWMPASPRVQISAPPIVIVKDMSELTAAERARVLEEAAGNQGSVYLIVTNTGTFLESAGQLEIDELDQSSVRSDLLRALEADDTVPVLGNRFMLLNVGRTDSIETACAVFRKMLAPGNWEPCAECGIRGECPVYTNVLLIQENEDTVVRRVELVYRRLYEYGVRLTLRQMTGHLAYALTAGRDCLQVNNLSEIALGECLLGSLFFNRFFGDDGEQLLPDAAQLYPVRQIREAEFGVELEPQLERDMWTRSTPRLPLSGSALGLVHRLRSQAEAQVPAARRQARRLVYFCGALDDVAGEGYLSAFLRSPMLLWCLKITRGNGHVPPVWEVDFRCRVLQVLQEDFAGVRLAEGSWQGTDRLYVTLNRRSAGASSQVVLASFDTREFRIAVQPGHRAVKGSSGTLVLTKTTGAARMPLDLPFLDYVARRYEGGITAQVSAFYADRLERFQAHLLHDCSEGPEDSQCLQLLRIGPDRRLRPVRILLSGDQMEVLR